MSKCRPLPPTSSSSLLPPSLPSSSSAPHHPSPGPCPPFRECQVPLLENNSTHSHLEPHPEDSYLLRAQPSSTVPLSPVTGELGQSKVGQGFSSSRKGCELLTTHT
ncbi:unnamed protein product [Pleuronectes platessa]|uniref:Uncharacterized protein n=1 Tax=Pleuronectes platessa TaxID=8262 RepID=A0A9N7V3C1_PLEPL|nr:unnamed protein product [Pleuronectes platessa]